MQCTLPWTNINFQQGQDNGKFFYYDNSGIKQGPVSREELQTLAVQGIITPQSDLETDDGHKGKAGQIKGLFLPPAVNPFASPQPVPIPRMGSFCTNCGQPVQQSAVACLSCGANPKGHKKFCGHCGVQTNDVQVVCMKCGSPLGKIKGAETSNGLFGERNQYIAALFALFVEAFGAHWFYCGFKKKGIVYLVISILGLILFGIPTIIMSIIDLVECIRFLVISQEMFNTKYVSDEY